MRTIRKTLFSMQDIKYRDFQAKLIREIRWWMESEHTYTIRFDIEMLMQHYLDAHFKPEYLD